MIAYCNNNPVKFVDGNGQSATAIIGIGIAVVATVVAAATIVSNTASGLGLIPTPIETIKRAINEAKNDVYEYAQSVRDSIAEFKKKLPHVHHIVPVGNFTSRSPATQAMIGEMHAKLSQVGINKYSDPVNLMLVSAGTHATLHTDTYIAHVYSYIMSAEGINGVYLAMYQLRLEIAAWDTLAGGF